MKKIFKLVTFAFLLFVFICTNAYALNVTEDEMIERVKTTETKVEETINLLTNWSNSHAYSLKSLVNRNFINQLGNLDVAYNIDLVINELNSNGYVDSANALSLMKTDLVNNYDYVLESLNMVEDYLQKHSSSGVTGNLDLFLQFRQTIKNLKNPIVDLVNIYYEMDYSDIRQKISQYDTASEILELYNDALEKIDIIDSIFSKFETRIIRWQEIYNAYYLSDYNSLFVEYFGEYYNKVRAEYNNLYTELETRLQNKLDEKIQVIVKDTDITDASSVMTRNTKLYDIMDYINEVKNEVISSFEQVNSLIKIEKVIEKVNNQQQRIIDRFDEAIYYTEDYIIDFPKLTVKEKEDEKYIKIDYTKGIIIYNQAELNESKFVDRLIATLGDIKTVNIYGGKIGTLSKIQLHYNSIVIGDYVIVVKGDIAPNAAFDITDVVRLCNKMFGKIELDQYLTIAADMNDDSKIDITDVVLLCNRLFNK